jgi:hypothetical protein
VRARYAALPSSVDVRDRAVEIHYDVEETPSGPIGVARLRLPEKIARTLTASELPVLDRPLRFIVTRGVRGAARGDTLEALQDELDRPFTDQEIAELDRGRDEHRRGRHQRNRGRKDTRRDARGGERGPRRGDARRRGEERRSETTSEQHLHDERRPRDEQFDGRRERPKSAGRFKPPRGGGGGHGRKGRQ